ncbi:MAG TPA: hypothetical protein VIB00_17355, partial [Pyrinomonadaceae bacterium]
MPQHPLSNQTIHRRFKRGSATLLTVALVLSCVSPACISPKRTPNLERIFRDARARTGKRPVIVIPGTLGSQLINSRTGEVEWPSVLR